MAALLGSLVLHGCAAQSQGSEGLWDHALRMVGLPRSVVPPARAAAPNASPLAAVLVTKRVELRMHAGRVLNFGRNGQSLPLVVKLYKLRSRASFEQAPYETFAAGGGNGAIPFLADVVETRELVFVPGQRYDLVGTVPPHVQFIAVVALFRMPVGQRWRMVFDVGSVASTGINLGLHGCAVSVAVGQALDLPVELMRVAGVHCEEAKG